ncbi:MAG: NYN domain-containing protein [Coriobacteriales bacterium]|jgi:hypothetical protein
MDKRTELRRRNRDPRRLFLVDIENAVGSGAVDEESCRRVRDRVIRDCKPNAGDMTVIGISHSGNAFPAAAWGSVRLVFRKGPSGADLELERVLSTECVEYRFDEVVIISGDGQFATQTARLRERGVKVTVDSRPHAPSRRLAVSCSAVWFAPDYPAA